MFIKNTKVTSFSLPSELVHWLQHYSENHEVSRSSVIREMIRQLKLQVESSKDQTQHT